MKTCRFEIRIGSSGMFQCAVKFGATGWAYLWKHNGVSDPCRDCPAKILGNPAASEREVGAAEFPIICGKLIRAKDWEEFKKRGISVGWNGIHHNQPTTKAQ